MKSIINFFDKLEDKIRGYLSRKPILYAIIGSIGIVLFWRGIWHTADMFLFMSGPVSTIIGAVILLITGVFVSEFIGNRLLITGLKGEKKLAEKTEEEIETEETELKHIEKTLEQIEKDISGMKK